MARTVRDVMSFDRLAPHYGWMEAVSGGGLLQRVRTARLDELAGCCEILSAGEGHGRFAEACAAHFPDIRLTCVEASARMLARGRRRIDRVPAPRASINWIHAALPEWTPPEAAFDAIVTCFFLACFDARTLDRVVACLARAAKPRALWLIADFSIPPGGPKDGGRRGFIASCTPSSPRPRDCRRGAGRRRTRSCARRVSISRSAASSTGDCCARRCGRKSEE
ncbi:MAG: class I SAM-dependent methyltransferase [Opitutaceae bacterium]